MRSVDHEQRRLRIAEFAINLIAAEGLSAATVRRIAADAGFSTTAITHYFADKQELLDAVQVAIERDRIRLQEARIVADLQARFLSLTTREREVFSLVVTGRPNKVIAAQLDLSEMTVKVHRSQITRKMQAKSLVDLVRMADRLEISAGKS